jgi:hypothetical protein
LALQHDLAALVGKYSDYVVSPAMFDMMPGSLKTAAKADFIARLQVVRQWIIAHIHSLLG